MLFDSHAHLDFVDDLEGTLARAKEAGLGKIVTIGTSVACSKKCIALAEKYSDSDLAIYATCGIHPEDGHGDIEKYGDELINELKKVAASSKKVVGIGECGLDYFLEGERKTNDKEKDFQRKLFADQIKLAGELDLPLIVHCRNAWEEIFDLIQGVTSRKAQGHTLKPGVFHSWTGDWDAAQKAIDLGFYISFSGIVTFKNATDIKEVAQKVPTGRMLIETDSPFLSPEPLRGRKNEPKNVKITADFISSLRGSSLIEISDTTTRNAGEVFRI